MLDNVAHRRWQFLDVSGEISREAKQRVGMPRRLRVERRRVGHGVGLAAGLHHRKDLRPADRSHCNDARARGAPCHARFRGHAKQPTRGRLAWRPQGPLKCALQRAKQRRRRVRELGGSELQRGGAWPRAGHALRITPPSAQHPARNPMVGAHRLQLSAGLVCRRLGNLALMLGFREPPLPVQALGR